MIEIQKLSAGYRDKEILHDIDLLVPDGKITVLVGPNGCGKSTLLKTIIGILKPTAGKILLNEQDSSKMNSQQLAQKVAYLAQSRQVPDITALKLVLHGRFPYLSYPRHYKAEDIALAKAAMEQMGIADLAEQTLQSLSGGTRQKVYIAMALCQNTEHILLDEPTTYLDVSHQLQLMEQARFLAEQGKAVLLVLHDLAMALQLADHLVVMDKGRLIACGTSEEIYYSGCLQTVFGIGLEKVDTPHGPQYYYVRGEKR